MEIIVICPDTVFGIITKTFDNMVDALKWVDICLINDLKVVEVTITQA
jgi:hypothetical protein